MKIGRVLYRDIEIKESSLGAGGTYVHTLVGLG